MNYIFVHNILYIFDQKVENKSLKGPVFSFIFIPVLDKLSRIHGLYIALSNMKVMCPSLAYNTWRTLGHVDTDLAVAPLSLALPGILAL